MISLLKLPLEIFESILEFCAQNKEFYPVLCLVCSAFRNTLYTPLILKRLCKSWKPGPDQRSIQDSKWLFKVYKYPIRELAFQRLVYVQRISSDGDFIILKTMFDTTLVNQHSILIDDEGRNWFAHFRKMCEVLSKRTYNKIHKSLAKHYLPLFSHVNFKPFQVQNSDDFYPKSLVYELPNRKKFIETFDNIKGDFLETNIKDDFTTKIWLFYVLKRLWIENRGLFGYYDFSTPKRLYLDLEEALRSLKKSPYQNEFEKTVLSTQTLEDIPPNYFGREEIF